MKYRIVAIPDLIYEIGKVKSFLQVQQKRPLFGRWRDKGHLFTTREGAENYINHLKDRRAKNK